MIKYKEELPGFNYQVGKKMTKLYISNAKKNYETLIVTCKKKKNEPLILKYKEKL